MKAITIAGNIGKDAVTRTTQGGDSVTGWTVAVEERNGQDKRTIWFDVSLWGKRGAGLAQYLTKGSKVTVSGDLSTREHDGKTYLTIRANDVTLQGGGKQDDGGHDQRRDDRQSGGSAYGASTGGVRDDLADDIPFAPEWRA